MMFVCLFVCILFSSINLFNHMLIIFQFTMMIILWGKSLGFTLLKFAQQLSPRPP